MKIQVKFYSAEFAQGFDYSFLARQLQVGLFRLSFYKVNLSWCNLRLVCSRESVYESFYWHFKALSGSLGEVGIGNKSLENYTFRRIIWVHLSLVCFEDRLFAAGAQFTIKKYFHRYMNLCYLYYFVINCLKYFIY